MKPSLDGTKAAGGSLGRRPPPPPPAPLLHGDEDAFVPVDNIAPSFVEAWFHEADADGDGRVADGEAREFFLRSGLPPAALSTIWRVVKPPSAVVEQGKGLSRRRFSQALRLIAMAQSGLSLTPALALAALSHETWLAQGRDLLPRPQIAPLPTAEPPLLDISDSLEHGSISFKLPPQADGPTSPSQQQPETAEEALITGLEFLGIPQQPPIRTSSGTATTLEPSPTFSPLGFGISARISSPEQEDLEDKGDDEDIFGLSALRQPAFTDQGAQPEPAGVGMPAPSSPTGRAFARLGTLENMSRNSRHFTSVSLEPPLAYELRYPPLNPKDSAKLSLITALNGSLFAGPSVENGLLQWCVPHGAAISPWTQGSSRKSFTRTHSDMRVTHEVSHAVPSEDPDAAPSKDIPASPRGRPASCLFADEVRGILWVGDHSGWVIGYEINPRPGSLLDPGNVRVHSWQAHRVGSVTSMCVSPTGELWTGSSRGSIRVWHFPDGDKSAHGIGKILASSVGLGVSGEEGGGLRARELRRTAGERPHNGSVIKIVSSADGQLIWTASRSGVCVWDSRTGVFLGSLHRDSGSSYSGYAASGSNVSNASVDNSLGGSGSVAIEGKISTSIGLKIDPLNGTVLARPLPAESERWALQQEAWAAQSDRGMAEFAERLSEGAGRAVKLMGKLSAKFIGGGGGGGGSANFSSSGNLNASAGAAANAAASAGSANLDDEIVPDQPSGGDIVGLVATPDNRMWVAFRKGNVERYSASGKLQSTRQLTGRVYTMAAVGRRVWLGFTNGMLSVLGPDGTVLKTFLAHRAGIVGIAPSGGSTFTLAADGSVNGWSSAIPSPSDDEALQAWHDQAASTYVRDSLNVLAVTWNCGETKPEPTSAVFRWLHEHAFDKGVVLIGLQEVEMGGTSVALAAAKNALASKMQEKGNANAQFWSGAVLTALGGERHWHQVGLRQLSGMLVVAFARNNMRGHIGEIATASVACGVLGMGGNKGAVAVEFTLHRQKFAVVCSHFAAHQGAVKARNSNYVAIAKTLTFSRRVWLGDDEDLSGTAVASSNTKYLRQTSSASRFDVVEGTLPGGIQQGSQSQSQRDRDRRDRDRDRLASHSFTSSSATSSDEEGDASEFDATSDFASVSGTSAGTADDLLHGEGLRGAAALVWLGDFNYRIEGQYDEVKELAITGTLDPLLACDQLRREMLAGRVFRGLREGIISFPPTYKFDKGVPSPAAYDSSEKRRVPAWCDRIFFRGSIPFSTPFPPPNEPEHPVDEKEGEVRVIARDYGSWGDVYDSDHRPVYAHLEVSLPVTNAAKKRELVSNLMHKYAAPAVTAGATSASQAYLSSSSTKLHPLHMPDQMILLSNPGSAPLSFAILVPSNTGDGGASWGGARGSFLEVRPARGIVEAGGEAEIRLRASPGGAGAYASGPREVNVRVLLGSEYGGGQGAEGNNGSGELEFVAVVLPEFAFDDKF